MAAYTLAQLEALEESIAAGAMSVSYEGKSISYRSLDDMLRVRGIMRRALGLSSAGSATMLAAHNRGYGG